MAFQWSEDLRTGIDSIDSQHQVLIGQLNDLVTASKEHKGVDEVVRFLSFLTEYVNRHFDDEEREMTRISYTGLARHRQEHQQYREKLQALRNDLGRAGATPQLVADAVWVAAEWFVTHIRQTDMAMAGALKAVRGRA